MLIAPRLSYAPECRDFATCICTAIDSCPRKKENEDIAICKYYSCPDFDFKKCSKYRPSKVGDFALPAKGERPSYCGRPFAYAVSKLYNARKDLHSHCNTLTCPKCGILSELQHVFALVVTLWCYSIFSGQYPSWGFASMDFSSGVSVEAIRRFRRNLKDRLERWGVTAGTTIFHPYRIKPEVQRAIRKILGIKGNEDTSDAFWNYLRDDHNEGHLLILADFMKIEINSIYDCLVLAPHFHFFIFPGNIWVTGKNPKSKKKHKSDEYDIFIQRLSHKINGKKHYELRSLLDIYKHVTYLYSHVGQLTDSRFGNIHIESPFGELFRWRPEKIVSGSGKLTFEDLIGVRSEVLALMNEGRNVKLEFNGELKWEGSSVDNDDWIPLSELSDYSPEGKKAIHAYLTEAKKTNEEYADYLRMVIARSNLIHSLKVGGEKLVMKRWRKLWSKPIPIEELPLFIKVLPPGHIIRAMFLEGLPEPPEGFRVFNSHQWEHNGVLVPGSEEMPEPEKVLKSLPVGDEYEKMYQSLMNRSVSYL